VDNYDKLLSELYLPKTQLIKGVKGLSNPTKIPETLEKGILRSKHNVFVYKDGTTRFDVTNAPLTHFKPSEIGLDLEKVKKLGAKEKKYLTIHMTIC
jgi:DNA polymerase II large subunit